jgi:hypothetical protein
MEKGEPAFCARRLCKLWGLNEYIIAKVDFILFMKRFQPALM